MSANRSAEEIVRQMWGRFDGGNGAEEMRHQTLRDARIKEVAAEDKHRSKGNTSAYTTGITGAPDDMGESDSLDS